MRWQAVVLQKLCERLARWLQHGRTVHGPRCGVLFPVPCPSWQRRPKDKEEANGALVTRVLLHDPKGRK